MLSELIQANLPYEYESEEFRNLEKSVLLFHVESNQYECLLNKRSEVKRKIVALKEQKSHSEKDV